MNQKNSLKRTLSGIVLTGLLISTFSTPTLLGVEQPGTASLKLSQKEIEKNAAAIKRVIIGVKTLKIAVQASVTGISLAFLFGGIIAAIAGIAPSGGTSIPAMIGAGKIMLILDIVIPMILFDLILAGAEKAISAGIKKVQWVVEKGTLTVAFQAVEKLERVERDFPGTLTLTQKKLVDQFNELARGSTMKAIIKALRLKGTLVGIIKSVMLHNQNLVAQLGGKKKTKKIIKKYINSAWRSKNFERALDEYREKKRKYKAIMKDRSPLSTAYHTAHLKLITLTLDPNYPLIKFKNNKAKKTMRKLNKKYPDLERALKLAIPDFIKKADAIVDKTKTELELLQRKLRKVMASVVDSIVKQSIRLAAPHEREQAYWIVREYVELRWKARNLQRTMDALRAQSKSIGEKIITAVKFTWVRYVVMRLQKAKVKKRIKQIEKKYSPLKPVLKNAWQTFTKKADAMIVEQFKAQS